MRGDLHRRCRPNVSSTSSSPHAQGSSGAQREASVLVAVVPARAGIFRPRLSRFAVTMRRPRTRGDLPLAGLALWSSPPSRGSPSQNRPGRHERPVIPARAGSPSAGRSSCTATNVSSRHARARGSSHRVELGPRGHGVVPARAGIFRTRRTHPKSRPRRRRTRGDLPGPQKLTAQGWASSPHARESSWLVCEDELSENVLPARAGIFHARAAAGRVLIRRPRTRGNLPGAALFIRISGKSSPHARGSSSSRRRGHRAGRVVPARAGIFHGRGRLGRHLRRRPRTRGDLPQFRRCWIVSASSSPHARESSCRAVSSDRRVGVVPACAGIFRAGSPSRSGMPRRPRTRGDLPPSSRTLLGDS